MRVKHFVRVTVMEWISWESPSWNEFRENLVFCESHRHGMNFVRVTVMEWISWEFSILCISWGHNTTKNIFRPSQKNVFMRVSNCHENYRTTGSSHAKFQMHIYYPNVFQYVNIGNRFQSQYILDPSKCPAITLKGLAHCLRHTTWWVAAPSPNHAI